MYAPDLDEKGRIIEERRNWKKDVSQAAGVAFLVGVVLFMLTLVNADVNKARESDRLKKQEILQQYKACVLESPKTLPANADASVFCKTMLGL